MQQPTTLLLARFRVQLTLPGRYGTGLQVAEEARMLGFTGPPGSPTWLEPADIDALVGATATANTPPDLARNALTAVLAGLPHLTEHLNDTAAALAEELREAHVRVRRSARGGETAGGLGVRGLTAEPQLPVDVLGTYVYLPAGSSR